MNTLSWICFGYVFFLVLGGVAGALAGSTISLFASGGAAIVLSWLLYQIVKNQEWAYWAALGQVASLTLFFGVRFWHTGGRIPLMCSSVSLLVFVLMLWFRKNPCRGETCEQKST